MLLLCEQHHSGQPAFSFLTFFTDLANQNPPINKNYFLVGVFFLPATVLRLPFLVLELVRVL